MKKNCFIVLFALLTFTLNNYAQDDASQDGTYNMVVKLPDGTTFTVNTDDVEEVSFSNGKVTVSGQALTDLLQRISQQNNRMDSLCVIINNIQQWQMDLDYHLYDSDARVLDLECDVTTLRVYNDQLVSDVASLKADNAALQTDFMTLASKVAFLEANNDKLASDVASLKADNAALASKVAFLETNNDMLASDVASLKADNAALQTDFMTLESKVASLLEVNNAQLLGLIDDLYMRIMTLESSMAELLEAKVKQERQNTTTTNP